MRRSLAKSLAVALLVLSPTGPSVAGTAAGDLRYATKSAAVPSGEVPSGALGGNAASFGAAPPGYRELVVAWNRWAYQLPPDNSPVVFGTNCAVAQSGPIWFLAGTLLGEPVERDCSIPRGRTLLLPLAVNTYLSTPAIGQCLADPWFHNPRSPKWVAALASIRIGKHSIKLTIDGHPAPKYVTAYARADSFGLRLPSDNILDLGCGADAPAGRYGPNVSFGWWALLPPLPPGKHTVKWKASFDYKAVAPLGPGSNEQDVIYHLIVRR